MMSEEPAKFGCLICSEIVTKSCKVREKRSALFDMLSKYMKWTPPPKYEFDFDFDQLPFCEYCKSSVENVSHLDDLLQKIHKQIDGEIANLTAKILDSENKLRVDGGSAYCEHEGDQLKNNGRNEEKSGFSRKINYYRNAIYRRYDVSVRLDRNKNLFDPNDNPDLNPVSLNGSYDFVQPGSTIEFLEPPVFEIEIIYGEDENAEVVEFCGNGAVEEDNLAQSYDLKEGKDEESTCVIVADESERKEEIEGKDTIVCKPRKVSQKPCGSIRPELEATEKNLNTPEALKQYFGRCKLVDRINFLGQDETNLHFSFDDKSYFVLNWDNTWSCRTCSVTCSGKRQIVTHLQKHCKGHSRAAAGKGKSGEVETEPLMTQLSASAVSDEDIGEDEKELSEKLSGESSRKMACAIDSETSRVEHGEEDFEVGGAEQKDSQDITEMPCSVAETQVDIKESDVEGDGIVVEENENCSTSEETSDDVNRLFKRFRHSERIRQVGKAKYVFDDEYPFELSSKGVWTCGSCRTEYIAKKNLVAHLANKRCKGKKRASSKGCANKNEIARRSDFVFGDISVRESFPAEASMPFGFAEERVKKVGHHSFLLDEKVRFECSRKKLRCASCDSTFKKYRNLRNHLDACPGDPPPDVIETYALRECTFDKLKHGEFQCRHCRILLSSNGEMVDHLMELHVGKLDLSRPLCIESEPNKFTYLDKFSFELVGEQFKCGTCFANFPTQSEVESHMLKNHFVVDVKRKPVRISNPSPGKYVVNENFSFQKIGNKFSCDQCPYTTAKFDLVKDHMKRKHVYFQAYVCHTCGKRSNRLDDLKKHLKIHFEEKPITCELCGKSFKLQNSLKLHQARMHLEVVSCTFSCNMCEEKFGKLVLLNKHKKSHESVICHVCGENVSGTKLYYHMTRHKEQNQCKICGKTFYFTRTLLTHEMSHRGLKPFSCDLCGVKFTRQNHIKRHKELFHNPNSTKKPRLKEKSRKRKLCTDIFSETEEDLSLHVTDVN